MNRRVSPRSTAGALGALAVGLTLIFTIAPPAAAHGPQGTDPPRTRSALPPALPGAAGLRVPTVDPSTGIVATTGAVPLRTLAGDAKAVVVGEVTKTESYDEDRLRVYHLHVARVLRGRFDDADARVVDVRGTSQRAPLLADGARAVVFLQPAPDLTYLTQQLPAGRHVVAIGGRDGVVPVLNDADVDVVDQIIAARTPAARRRLAFIGLRGANARLANDALLELRAEEALSPLTDEERDIVQKVLGDTRVPAMARIGLLGLLGEREVREALPAVLAAETDTPAVLDAVLGARSRLAAPVGREELAPYLGSKDAGVRAAALRALARLDDPAALAELDRHATGDPELAVRVAAIEALGETKRASAVPVLAKTFGANEREVKQASAQALVAVGGPAVDDALVSLALRGDSTDTQTYAALLLVTMHGRDSEAVRRIEAGGPSPEVTQLLQHGLEFRHSHVH